jgi:hypothetical protein
VTLTRDAIFPPFGEDPAPSGEELPELLENLEVYSRFGQGLSSGTDDDRRATRGGGRSSPPPSPNVESPFPSLLLEPTESDAHQVPHLASLAPVDESVIEDGPYRYKRVKGNDLEECQHGGVRGRGSQRGGVGGRGS